MLKLLRFSRLFHLEWHEEMLCLSYFMQYILCCISSHSAEITENSPWNYTLPTRESFCHLLCTKRHWTACSNSTDAGDSRATREGHSHTTSALPPLLKQTSCSSQLLKELKVLFHLKILISVLGLSPALFTCGHHGTAKLHPKPLVFWDDTMLCSLAGLKITLLPLPSALYATTPGWKLPPNK